jgi:hypothetical protein
MLRNGLLNPRSARAPIRRRDAHLTSAPPPRGDTRSAEGASRRTLQHMPSNPHPSGPCVVPGATHEGERLWFVAAANGQPVVWPAVARPQRLAWPPEPRVPRLAHGLPAQRNIAHAFGNAISPLLGATFITNAIEALRDAENSDRLYNPLEVVS